MIDIEKLLEQTDLVELARRAGAELKKRGAEYRGPCPLHGGDNPSAFVIYENHNRQMWHCFTGCGDGGDAIDFVAHWRHLSVNGNGGFLEAVKILADEENISLSEIGIDEEEAKRLQAEREKQARQRDILTLAASYYEQTLHAKEGEAGWTYAQSRGWSEETIKGMGLGYSDGSLLACLNELDADIDLALEAGLIYRRRDGSLSDAIPAGYLVYVHRRFGAELYLSGRATFTDGKGRKARNLHAPRHLYWATRRSRGPVVVVEGQACAITCWQWGYNAVGLCGTSLSKQDVKAINAYKGVYLALDPDASDKIGKVADRLGPLTMVVEDIPAADINAWLTEAGGTGEDLSEALHNARPWIAVAIERASKAPAFELDERLEHLAALVARLPESARSKYIRDICTGHHLSGKRDFQDLVEQQEQTDEANTNGFEVIDGRLCHFGDPLCNWAGWITHELINDDGLNPPQITYTIEGTLETGEPLEPLDIDAEVFDGMKWVGKHWGARPIIYLSPGKTYKLRRAIQEVSMADMKRERVYTFTGWTKLNGHWRYLTTSGGIGTDGLDPSVRVDLGVNNLSRYELPNPTGDLRQAIRASLGFMSLAPNEVTLPLWAAMYAAPLTPIKSLNAVLWVYGTTQSGKSTLAHLALTHFGPSFIDGHEYNAPKDWISTVTSLEGALFSIKDAPIVVDDFAPAHSGASEARRLAKKAHRTVRSVGNRSARGRARVDLSEQKQRPPRGVVIATAENPLIGQSIVGRMIYIPVEPGQIIQDHRAEESMLDVAQQEAQSGLYAQAMAGYIAWLAERWEELREELPDRITQTSRVGRAIFPSGQARLTDYYGLLVESIRLALEYACDYGVVEEGDVESMMELYRLELVDLLHSQSERVAGESPTVKFWQAMSDLLAQKKIHLAPRLDNGSFVPPERSDLVGWYDDENVYLMTNAALAQVKRYWQALDERFDTRTDTLHRELWQRDFVAERADRQLQRKTYIRSGNESKRERTLWIDREILLEKAGISPEPDVDEPEPIEL